MKKFDDPRSIRIFFFINWFTYFSIYFGRYNLSACINDMSLNHGFEKPALGSIVAAFYLTYGVGQLLSGFLGEKIPPKWQVFIGMTVSAVINLIFAFQNIVWMMFLLWFLNGLAQALVWSPIIKLCSDRLTVAQCRKTCIDLCTTGPLGMLATYLLCACLLRFFSWRISFVAAFIAMTGASCFWLVGMTRMERQAEKNGVFEELTQLPAVHGKPAKLLPIVFASGMIFIVAPALINGMLKDGITTWIPTFLAENFTLDTSISTGLATLLPVVNLIGVYLAKLANDRIFANELKTSVLFFAVSILVIMGIVLVDGLGVLILIGLLAISTSAMVGVNTLLVGLVPLYFRRCNRISTVTGILNSATYLGGALASYLFGFLAEQFGWNMNYTVWLILAGTGCILCALGARRWGRFSRC